MDLRLTREQEDFRQSCRSFLETEWPTTRVREFVVDGSPGHSDELWDSMAKLGWLGLPFDEQYGGSGASLIELGIAYEEGGRALLPTTFASTMHAALLLDRLGTGAQKQAWLTPICDGAAIATVAFSELRAEHSVAHFTTTATKSEDGWVLNGAKSFVPNAERADLLVIAARLGETDELALFLVPKGTEGVRTTQHYTFSHDAQHVVELDAARVEANALLGAPGGETAKAYASVGEAVLSLQCMEIAGGIQKVLDVTCAYVTGRIQFERPIGSFQAVQHIIANVGIGLRGGRMAALQALTFAAQQAPAAKEVSLAKAALSKVYTEGTVWAHQIHGGMGYVRESDLHLWSQRAKTLEVQLGTPEFHLQRVADCIFSKRSS